MDEYRFLRGLVAEGEDKAALAALKDRALLCQMMNAQQMADDKDCGCHDYAEVFCSNTGCPRQPDPPMTGEGNG